MTDQFLAKSDSPLPKPIESLIHVGAQALSQGCSQGWTDLAIFKAAVTGASAVAGVTADIMHGFRLENGRDEDRPYKLRECRPTHGHHLLAPIQTGEKPDNGTGNPPREPAFTVIRPEWKTRNPTIEEAEKDKALDHRNRSMTDARENQPYNGGECLRTAKVENLDPALQKDSAERLAQAKNMAEAIAKSKTLTPEAAKALDGEFFRRLRGETSMFDLLNGHLKEKGLEINLHFDLSKNFSLGSRIAELVDTRTQKIIERVDLEDLNRPKKK